MCSYSSNEQRVLFIKNIGCCLSVVNECLMEIGLKEGIVCGFDLFLLNCVLLFEFVLLLLHYYC
jgi:hypothetical protein